ncbi:low temperature requirement protein A [Micromonospora purpureochromogenes]|uniref:Low temperature requirement protein LtrA n=1 Tax=Micromonospora purpureochromogenes TaxID=47872 RepID=A0ABX2RP04_9ACTN|nr:low temperature requirement protein A [Micromonospora purpureochromogenes]NYF57976.1 low temperature requirement protein LtrA [Micromonospora purpureochromogenes]
MTTGRAEQLLRKPEQGRSAFLELFFDLVFVFAFFRLSQELLEHLSWTGAFQTLVLLLPVLHVWAYAARFTDLFDPRNPLIQLLVVSMMFGVLVMAAAAPEAFGRNGLVFAGAYVTVRVGVLAVGVLLLRGHEGQRNALRLLFWVGVAAVPWLTGAFLPGGARGALWMTAAAVEYVGIALGFRTPGLGRAGARRRADILVVEEHVAERYQQFFIIALGEPILVTGLAFGTGEFTADRSAATLVAFATTALLWRIYIHRAGALLADAMAAAPDPRRVAVLTIYSHVIMVAGMVVVAVGDELVIQHPLGHTDPAWLPVILGGPALFLAGRAIFEYAVFGRVSLPRVIGALALVALTPAMRPMPPLAVATAAALVLAGVAVADAARTRRLPSEPPSPPG